MFSPDNVSPGLIVSKVWSVEDGTVLFVPDYLTHINKISFLAWDVISVGSLQIQVNPTTNMYKNLKKHPHRWSEGLGPLDTNGKYRDTFSSPASAYFLKYVSEDIQDILSLKSFGN